MKMSIKQAHNMQLKPGNKSKLPTGNFLTRPSENGPATSSVLGHVTVNDSDDSSHLTETTLTTDPVQFEFVLFHF